MSNDTATQTRYIGVYDLSGAGEIEIHCCGACGAIFGFSKALMDIRRNDHRDWFCPNGHSWHYDGENTEEKLRRERNEARDRAARLAAEKEQAEASLRSTKGVVTKLKKRVANGVCPCCNRSFQDLAAHMETKHPDWSAA